MDKCVRNCICFEIGFLEYGVRNQFSFFEYIGDSGPFIVQIVPAHVLVPFL